jgi:hypothetical protein
MEHSIIVLCMPAHSSHLLQPLDVGCFAVLKRSYGRLVEQKMSLGVNHINKQEFIPLYQQARSEALHERNIQSGFAATGLVPHNPERVLSILHTPIHTPSPQLLPQEAYSTATPHNISKLQQQAELIKQHLKRRRRTQSPPSPTDQALNQLIKGCQMAMHSTILLATQNEQLMEENKHQKQNRAKRRKYTARGGIVTGAEARELAQNAEYRSQEAQTGNQAEPQQRAPPRCSLCTSLEHKANRCPGLQGVV